MPVWFAPVPGQSALGKGGRGIALETFLQSKGAEAPVLPRGGGGGGMGVPRVPRVLHPAQRRKPWTAPSGPGRAQGRGPEGKCEVTVCDCQQLRKEWGGTGSKGRVREHF